VNFLINTYYIFLKKYGAKGVEASIYGLTFPLTLNFITLLTFLFFFFRKFFIEIDIVNFISTALISIVFFFVMNGYLERKYLKNENFTDLFLPKLFYLFAPLHYLISVFLFIISLRYS